VELEAFFAVVLPGPDLRAPGAQSAELAPAHVLRYSRGAGTEALLFILGHTHHHSAVCSLVCTTRRPFPLPSGSRNARAPTSPRGIGFCVILGCIRGPSSGSFEFDSDGVSGHRGAAVLRQEREEGAGR
jgi:hypothetical protein